jgi:hypothetical protein
MKKAIERLERVLRIIPSITVDSWVSADGRANVKSLVEEVLEELKARPRWYTPEQWAQLTGKPWPDDWAVYYRSYPDNEWSLFSFKFAKYQISIRGVVAIAQIICVTEAGKPPESWRPEEENR